MEIKHMELFALGINHKNTPLKIRERFAFKPELTLKILRELKCSSLID